MMRMLAFKIALILKIKVKKIKWILLVILKNLVEKLEKEKQVFNNIKITMREKIHNEN